MPSQATRRKLALGAILGWPAWKRRVLAFGIHAIYWVERLFTWRRMTILRPPERRNALGEESILRA